MEQTFMRLLNASSIQFIKIGMIVIGLKTIYYRPV